MVGASVPGWEIAPESLEVALVMKFTHSSCVSGMVSPYFFTLVKLSPGYTARL
jgi:hypothetical protein